MPRSTLPLDLVSHLASLSGDPDWEFPLTLKEGVPLGVSDPTLTSPGVWPTKEELKGEAWLGEDPPPPVAHDNYPTAELFASEIEATFYVLRGTSLGHGGRALHSVGGGREVPLQTGGTLPGPPCGD